MTHGALLLLCASLLTWVGLISQFFMRTNPPWFVLPWSRILIPLIPVWSLSLTRIARVSSIISRKKYWLPNNQRVLSSAWKLNIDNHTRVIWYGFPRDWQEIYATHYYYSGRNVVLCCSRDSLDRRRIASMASDCLRVNTIIELTYLHSSTRYLYISNLSDTGHGADLRCSMAFSLIDT